MRRYKANQPHRQGVYALIVGYCRAKIIRDSKQAGAYRGLFGTIRESKTLCPRARARISPLMLFTVIRNYEKLRLVAKKRWFYGNHYARVSIRVCRSFCFLRLYEIIKNWRSSRAGAYWSDNHIFDHHSTRKKPWPLDHFRRIKNGIFSGYAAARSRTTSRKHW